MCALKNKQIIKCYIAVALHGAGGLKCIHGYYYKINKHKEFIIPDQIYHLAALMVL